MILKNSVVWNITLFSLCKADVSEEHGDEKQAKQETGMKNAESSFMTVSCLAYSSAVNIVATGTSETSVCFQRTTRPYIPEDRNLHSH
jgi:hypothetical protein